MGKDTTEQTLNQASFRCRLHDYRITRQLPPACLLHSDGWAAELQRRQNRAWALFGSSELGNQMEGRREMAEIEICRSCIRKAKASPVVRCILAQRECGWESRRVG